MYMFALVKEVRGTDEKTADNTHKKLLPYFI